MPTVLITGAARGIGRAAVARLSRAGWDVVAGVRSGVDGDDLVAEFGAAVHPIQLDIADSDDIAALPDRLPGRLDAVVNNAGIAVEGPIETLPLDDIRRQLEVNVVGQVAVTQAALPLLRESRGRLIFVSSLSGRVSTPMTGAYNASKFALEGLVDALRVELRPWRIKVVLVQPGPVATDIWRHALDRHSDLERRLSPEHRLLYQRHLDGNLRVLRFGQRAAVPVDKVATTIERALTAAHPRPRYQVDVPGRLQVVAAGFSPAIVRDTVFARAFGVGSSPAQPDVSAANASSSDAARRSVVSASARTKPRARRSSR